MSQPSVRHEARLAGTAEQTMDRVAQMAEDWGGEWQYQGPTAGYLKLPVSAGVRRGWIGYEVAAQPADDGSSVTLQPAEEHLHVDRPTVAVLATSLLGALLFLIVPFVPRLMPLLPVGFLLAVSGWFFVVARLRNSGPEEFLEMLEAGATTGNESGDDA